jgi:D-lyxose ketol-isomerase
MKRSAINRAVVAARDFLKTRAFALPPFASWTPEEWRQAGPDCRRIVDCRLGWDVTDFGRGDFDRLGAVLFTIRNGVQGTPGLGTPYAEKIIILAPGQRLPLHLHWSKQEDIINRGGGILVMELYNARKDESLDRDSPVTAWCDGRERKLAAGVPVKLGPGESMTLTPGSYHRFWADPAAGTLLVGEVSTVNDDDTDNLFAETVSRFATVEEDEPPAFLLCNEYASIARPR